MKVFIADDEIFVVELLKHLVDWDALGITIAGTATDGLSAINKIKELSPDIIITDIRMPNADGLEVVRQVKEVNPNAAFIIISGHNNFEYAQTAIKYGVKDYILKPINEQEITEVLQNAAKSISGAMELNTKIQQISNSLSTATQKIHKAFLDDIATKAIGSTAIELINKEYMLNFREGGFRFFVLKVDCKHNANHSAIIQQLGEKVYAAVQAYIAPRCYETVFAQCDSKFILLINFNTSNTEQIDLAFVHMLEAIETQCKKFASVYFTICKGVVVTETQSLYDSYFSAHQALHVRCMGRLNTIIDPPCSLSRDRLKGIFTSDAQADLARSIEQFDSPGIKSLITRLFVLVEGLENPEAELFFELSLKIYELFLKSVQNLDICDDYKSETDRLMTLLDDCLDVDALRNALIATIQNRIEKCSAQEPSQSAYITIAKKYISDHYMDKITLESISQLVFLNPVYFSILFKQEVGINFVDYLNKYRIEMSKALLKDISLSLTDIGCKVGFASAKYYAKIFKKIVGITPSQYRSKCFRHGG